MDHCLVYFSTSVGLFREQELAVILQQSRRHNAKAGITGVLLYVRGRIIQVLEGPPEQLESLYGRIQQDQRHRQVTRILNRPITRRLFGQWSMGYETLNTRQLDTLQTVLNFSTPVGLTDEADQHNILRIIRLFYESNRHN